MQCQIFKKKLKIMKKLEKLTTAMLNQDEIKKIKGGYIPTNSTEKTYDESGTHRDNIVSTYDDDPLQHYYIT